MRSFAVCEALFLAMGVVENVACNVDDVVRCLGAKAECKGNQCCPDGSTCPSAFPTFHGCPRAKAYQCSEPHPDPYPTPYPTPHPTPNPTPNPTPYPTPPPSPHPAPHPEPAEYAVGDAWFDVPGYVCGNQNPRTRIFYPISAKGKFPPIVYGHGTIGGIDGCDAALRSVAAMGFVVIAPLTMPRARKTYMKCSEFEWKDMLLSLQVARNVTSSDQVPLGFQNIDWSHVGVWGYSMGGKAAPTAAREAEKAGFSVGAVLASHGARRTTYLRIPTMFTTGTFDHIEPSSVTMFQFNRTPAKHKAFVNLEGGRHDEPFRHGRLTAWGGRFFGCHLSRFAAHCDAIYGFGHGALRKDGAMSECIVEGSNPLLHNVFVV